MIHVGEIAPGHARQHGEQIVFDGQVQAAAGFHHRENRCDFRSRLGTAYVQPVLRPKATGRMEFSARLLESSTSA